MEEQFAAESPKPRLSLSLAALIPPTSAWWKDMLSLWFAAFLQLALIPSLAGKEFVDVVTPWLVVNFVVRSPTRCFAYATLAAIILETHSMCPAGLYVTGYITVAALLLLFRELFSWRHRITWAATMFAALIWINGLELFVISVVHGTNSIGWEALSVAVTRTLTATGVGLLFYQNARVAIARKELGVTGID